MEDERRPEAADLEGALTGPDAELSAFLDTVHAADLAEFLLEVEESQLQRVFGLLDLEGRKELVQFAGEEVREELLKRIEVRQLVEVVEELPADEAVDLLAVADDHVTEEVLRSVDFERAQGLRELATYDSETAGGLMTTDFHAVPADVHVGDAIKQIRSDEGPAGEEEVGVFVTDEEGRPIGFVSDRELLTTPIHTPIGEVMETGLITVPVEADQEEVANLASKYSLNAVPVVGSRGELIGVVSAEDALDVLEEELEEDIRRLVGASPKEQTHLPVLVRVRSRLPLQALTVLGGLVTAWILDRALPSGVHGGAGDVLRYLPIIIGLAGNVGIQSSTILVRAIATGELSQEREGGVFLSEMGVGTVIGLICGLATALVAALMEGPAGEPAFQFGMAVGGAIVVAVTWAAFLGCLVPLTCQRIGIDPAIVAGPFLIALSDISGAAIFVVVATMTLDIGG